MSAPVIRGEGLGKRYRRGLVQSNGLLRDSLGRVLKSPLRALQRQKQESFWALKDVSLEVKEGEVLGLIGRNGAGKTTLLKILSRITQPTSGWAEIHGRVGSLLEVGTGFHPELTGRENTFLSGAILGMSKREISSKFDEIVAFAELEKFIDTPVKHYSSGMYVRLAFAVAAHLEPEILLVDEVLAVGDINFQKKCLGKMGDVARAGRTVVLVSHNMGAITQLCKRVVLIEEGHLTANGDPEEIAMRYIRNALSTIEGYLWDRTGSGHVKLTSVQILDAEGSSHTNLSMGHCVRIRASGISERPGTDFNFAVQFVTTSGVIAMWLYDQTKTFRTNSEGKFTIETHIPELWLMPGSYVVSLWLGRAGQDTFDWVTNAVFFEVVQSSRIPVTDTVTNHHGLVFGQSETTQLV
jgi:lipopolysaccharide transport system ATP-binding protein